ncbi:MAG: TolC family protein [Acidobacteria bacterium]|nr:TolC family protein [Acidobacteriota bacterium]
MNRLLAISMLCALLHGAEPRVDTPVVLRFEEVLDRAVSRATAEDARLEMARDNLKLLETLGKARFELRPTLGLLAFSNPFLLATNIGAGLLFNRQYAPSASSLESARFDTLASELQANATRIRARIEAARGYFELLEKQEISDRARAALTTRKERAVEVNRLLLASRITAFEQIAFEQELLDLESQVIDANAQQKASAARLALLIGVPAQDLRIEDVNLYSGAWDRPAPPLKELLFSATERRGEIQLLRGKIESLRAAPKGGRKPQVESIYAGYSQILGAPSNPNNLSSFLLGITGRGDVTLRIPLRDTGEKAAESALKAARIRFLETEIRNLEETIRSEITALETEAAASLEKVRINSRRLDLARKAYHAVESRVSAGLAQPSALTLAERAVLEAQWNQVRSVNERKSSLFTLFALAGIEQTPGPREDQKPVMVAADARGN